MKISNFNKIENLFPLYVKSNINKLLVLGCGELRHEMNLNAKYIFGIDWADEKLNIAKNKSNVIAIKYDVRNIIDILCDKSFDCVVMFDFLEHLTKDDATKLLYELEKKVINQIILFIPIQEPIELSDLIQKQEERKNQNLTMGYHLSYWKPEEFYNLGFIGEYSPKYHQDKNMGAVFCVKNL